MDVAYEQAVVQEDAYSQNNLAVMYAKGRGGVSKNDEQAVAWYRKSAEQGYAVAQFNLGVRYENGHGVLQDELKAADWYRKAAEQGHSGALRKVDEISNRRR